MYNERVRLQVSRTRQARLCTGNGNYTLWGRPLPRGLFRALRYWQASLKHHEKATGEYNGDCIYS